MSAPVDRVTGGDTVPAPAFMSDEEIVAPARKRRRSPEHAFQAWVDRLIDRIVLPPMFVTGIDHASQTTDNARARMAGRGIKFGIPDVFVCQRAEGHPRSAWLELKRGSKLSGAQESVHHSLHAAGQDVTTCNTMADVVLALRAFRFVLHPNADELAREYELRVTTNEKAPATPRKVGKSRAPRSRFTARDRKAAGIYASTFRP